LVGLGLASLTAAPVGAQEPTNPPPAFRFIRPVPVTAPGWSKLRLDAGTRALMQPDARDLRVRDAVGAEVPHWLLSDEVVTAPASIAAQLTDVAETPEGWSITIDLGPQVPAHQRLRFAFAPRGIVPRVRLESSPDSQAWSELATVNLFRLGESQNLQQTEIPYPPTTDRYLRLAWPKSAGVPDLREVFAEPAPSSGAETSDVPLKVERTGAAPGFAEYRLVLPGPGLVPESLRLTWSGAGIAAYRVQRSLAGSWQTVAEGTLRPGGDTVPLATADLGDSGASNALRLELRPGGDAVPEVTGATARIAVPWVLFYVATPGPHSLEYGAVGLAPSAAPDSSPVALADAVEVPLGDAVEVPLPALPASVTAPGAALDASAFKASWPVVAEGAAPGDLVRLVVPDAVYDVAASNLSDVRLTTGGQRLPHVLQPLAEPVSVTAQLAVVPRPMPEAGKSHLLVQLSPYAHLPIRLVELAAAATPFQREVTAGYLRDAQGPELPRSYDLAPLGSATWACPGVSVQPCRLAFPADGSDSGWLLATFDDGENAPLPAVDVRAWRQGHEMIFPWPGGTVNLLAGNPELGAAHYDLAAVANQLSAYPTHEARLVASAPRPPPSTSPVDGTTSQWALLLAIGVAGLVLLAVLARVLRGAGE
jgi:hypothetical protein